MKIQVSNPAKPGILNNSYAALFTGQNDVLMYRSENGYIPENMEGWTHWKKYTDVFGSTFYMCETNYQSEGV